MVLNSHYSVVVLMSIGDIRIILHAIIISVLQYNAAITNGRKKCENKKTIPMSVSEIKKDPHNNITRSFPITGIADTRFVNNSCSPK